MTSTPKNQSIPPQTPVNKPVTDDAILKVAKEVVVKFIENGRLAPVNFDETFKQIHQAIKETVRG